MKKHATSTTGRTALGALFLVLSVGLVILAVNSSVLNDGVSGNLQAQGGPTPIPAAPKDTGPKIGYENFTAPGVLTPVKTTEAGQQANSVEFLGRNAGEPSVGSNWATGVANFQSGLQTLFISFEDNCPASGLSSNWVNRAAPTSVAIDSDPIGFTDRGFSDSLGLHSRVFAGELTLLSPNTVKISFTDDDGLTWVPTQSGGIASGVDHETIGGGIYHSPIPPRPPDTVYPYAIYYCSQDIATAFCSRSDNGGVNYGPSVPLYTLLDCGGLHGHVKVSPKDGTVYVPNPDCGSPSRQAVVVSEDNGNTWTVREVPVANPGGSGVGSDPAVHVDDNGRLYFLGAVDGSVAAVATSDDFGETWQNIFDISSEFGLKQIAFPAATAGTQGRAAVAFYGSTGTGNSNAASFLGAWHLYVSHTFDGGQHWTTTDATPNAPMQRAGLLRGGGANITRNLLDFFDITIDRDGRVLVGYVNGCEGGPCAQAAPTATGNAYTVTATIARQSSGRRMIQGKDPVTPTTRPGIPLVTQVRIGLSVRLLWSEADTGNSPILNYQIWRGTSPHNVDTLVATVPGTQTGGSYEDLTANDITKTYYYQVLAVNAVATSCTNNEIAAPYVGDGCSGVIMHKNDPAHPEANAGTATPPSLLIDYVAVGEPASSPGNFMFKMKVDDLTTVPPNSRWRITWNSPDAETYPPMDNPDPTGDPLFAQQFYVGMTTGPSGPPTFEYGTLADAGLPAVFVISETKRGDALAGSNFKSDGTITIFVPKTAFGPQVPTPTAPAVGSLLGAVGGRTFTGDAPGSPESRLERSNTFVDHTFVKAQTDNSYPPATYTVAGNLPCPVAANSPPIAVLHASPASGNAPLTVTFDATGSSDPDFGDTIANYHFNFGDGNELDSGAPIVQHTYNSPGTYNATLVVTDSRGLDSQNTSTEVITVSQASPTPTPSPTVTPSASPTPSATPSATPTPTPSPSPSATASVSPSATPSPSASPSATASPTPSPTPSPSATPSATPLNVQLLNISGRVYTQNGDKVGIGGFIISGSSSKRIMARAMGTSLKASNGSPLPGRLQDPTLELHDDKGSPSLFNDNWRTSQEAEIEQSGLAPVEDNESAIIKRLDPGQYTAIIRGADGSPGIGLIELYDLSENDPAELGNLSVRADAQLGDNVLINGLILRGGTAKQVVFRALGPSIKGNDGEPLPGTLQDPTLEVHDGNGMLLLGNDDWETSPTAGAVQAAGLAPSDHRESALLLELTAGNYTSIVKGKGGETGIALGEAYKLNN